MNILAGVAAIIALCAMVAFGGYRYRDQEAKAEAAVAEAKFIKEKLQPAAEAYANQKILDDIELAGLKAKVDDTPPNPTIAVKKDMTSRIGAIR